MNERLKQIEKRQMESASGLNSDVAWLIEEVGRTGGIFSKTGDLADALRIVAEFVDQFDDDDKTPYESPVAEETVYDFSIRRNAIQRIWEFIGVLEENGDLT